MESHKGDQGGGVSFRADSQLVARVREWSGDYPLSLVLRAFLGNIDRRRRKITPLELIAELESQP